jgi:hypothetical protein
MQKNVGKNVILVQDYQLWYYSILFSFSLKENVALSLMLQSCPGYLRASNNFSQIRGCLPWFRFVGHDFP